VRSATTRGKTYSAATGGLLCERNTGEGGGEDGEGLHLDCRVEYGVYKEDVQVEAGIGYSGSEEQIASTRTGVQGGLSGAEVRMFGEEEESGGERVRVYIVGSTNKRAGPWRAQVKVLPSFAHKQEVAMAGDGLARQKRVHSGRDGDPEAQARLHDRR
jgi:hypothetical protein